MAVFGAEESWSPLDDLGEITKQALPRVSVPQQGDEAPVADLTPTPAAWSEEELLREKDFAAYTDAERAAARRLLARIARRARSGSRAGRFPPPAGATSTTCGRRSALRCAPAASCSNGAIASRRCARGGSC